MDGLEEITLKFDGGLAATGRLHFYEFGRSQYAFARFVATVEHFRQTGDVAEHISRGTYVDIFVSSPQRGSFLETILVPAAVKVGSDFVAARLSSLLSYIWHVISPRRESTDETVAELAKIKLVEHAAAAERTRQSVQKTKQLEILRDIANGDRASAEMALELIKWAMSTPNVAVGRLDIGRDKYEDMGEELEAEIRRIAEFQDSEDDLNKIDEDTLNQLSSRLRPMIPEITLPLRRSAKTMYLGGSPKAKPFIFVNKEIAESVVKKESEETIADIIGRVNGYDRDAGVGKFSSSELPRPLNFIVPLRDRAALRDKILSAMRRDRVLVRCRKIIDQSGMPTSLILIDIREID